tara:strand:+ start:70 stop:393 length:324 start_codon:yes stop_codon:yes gene_type:complete
MTALVKIAQEKVAEKLRKDRQFRHLQSKVKGELTNWPFWEPGDYLTLNDESSSFERITCKMFIHPGYDRITIQGPLFSGRYMAYVNFNLRLGIFEHVEIEETAHAAV